MIRNKLEFEVVQKRVRYLEAQLAVLSFDDGEDALIKRARLSVELDRARRDLAEYVSGVGALR